jgi:phage terminase large subunit-like protein
MSTVSELLSRVDYSYDPNYVPSKFAIKFVNFIKMMTDGKGESSPTPTMHYKMLDTLAFPSNDFKHQRIANLASRGSSKTSIFSEILFFYIAVFGEIDEFGAVDAIIYVSDTVENGVRSLKKNMESRYETSDFLKKYIPKAVFNQNEIYLTNIDGRKTGIRMFGAQSGIRGTKIFAKRPQLAILDDLLSDKNAKSEGIVNSILDTVYKGVDQALDPNQRKIVFSGTPFNQGDPLYMAIESGSWINNVYPICEKFPCTKEEFRGSWEERFSYEFIQSQYEALKDAGQIEAFYQELMLEINSEDGKLVDSSDINWYKRTDLFKQRSNYNFYITTDFATSEKKSADYSAISVWAVNNAGHIMWVDGILERQTMDKNIDELFRLAHKYNPISVGVEVNGTQNGFIPWIKQEMFNRNQYFSLAKTVDRNGKATKVGILSATNKSKLERFNIMLPDIKNGKLWLPSDVEGMVIDEIQTELFAVTSRGMLSKHDDWLDTFSMLGSMQIITPEQGTVMFNHEEDRAYKDYWEGWDNQSTSEISTFIV